MEMSNRPNEVLRQYIVSVATNPPDDFTKEGIDSVPPDIIYTIDSKSSAYLTGFAVAFSLAYQLIDGFVISPFLTETMKVSGNREVNKIANNVIRSAAIFKAIEYLSCRTLFDRGYTVGKDDPPIVVH